MTKKFFQFHPIETKYAGVMFRSRLEARHAVFFDTLGIAWEYEKEGYNLNGTWYLPDFYLPQLEAWVEIKGQEPTEEERNKARDLALYTQKRVYTFYGNIELSHDAGWNERLNSFVDKPAYLSTYPETERPSSPSARRIANVPAHIIVFLQQLDDASLRLAYYKDEEDEEGEIIIHSSIAPYSIEDRAYVAKAALAQHQLLTSLDAFIDEHLDELTDILTPDDGFKIWFTPQPRYFEDDCVWCECDQCGTVAIHTPFLHQHECTSTTHGHFHIDTPRLLAAYEAARSARF